MASYDQRCRAGKGCMNQAVAWEYPTMGPPRVICREHARKSKSRLAAFWGELDLGKEPPKSMQGSQPVGYVADELETAVSPAQYREWARENGWEIGDRGRVSLEIRKAYESAH